LLNTLKENKDSYQRVKELRNKLDLLSIAAMMSGGRKVKACLLFDDLQSPDAAYKALQRLESQGEK